MSVLMIQEACGNYAPAPPETIAAEARRLRESRWLPQQVSFSTIDAVRDYLDIQLAESAREVFCVLFLDSQHRLIACEELFQGTLDAAAVYPREVVKAALKHNAGAVILAHNHPSGVTEPSAADRHITKKLVEALGLVDCRVLDHFIVGHGRAYSFAEHRLL
ncbi:DNA repair protein RadC [Halomonas sp. McH1-25]|uniref:RadC family protein n=1 Tax=unclassified Halomonas TaxID=2609666 RepID=UPI001EF44773|nr:MULTISPECIES: DNA repair protein RadC [unclassified Halomonas]MCG7601802.1 DNA repair protein RadC [Halomonas sp. McH1-25]MCP1343978.1 DNA repair protein RadC [Halomonas sp. FL8]MCP1361789.1 DNA repair protein RadC [Halomonas sp. BBD45]MCP1364569.1 DNA repair protein RadC [Halomonas sp. BBD48]